MARYYQSNAAPGSGRCPTRPLADAFEWFGGVPEKVTPDNLKAAIIVASAM